MRLITLHNKYVKLLSVILPLLLSAILYSQNIACLGNSITHGPYPNILQYEYLNNGPIVSNFGHPDAMVTKTSSKSYWKTSEFQTVQDTFPDYIIFILGTNDSQPYWWNLYKNTFKEDYISYIDSLQNLTWRVFVGTCPPVWTNGILGERNDNVKDINNTIKQIADSMQVQVLDFYELFNEDSKYFWYDGIHPNDDGSRLMAELAASAIQELKVEDEYWEAADEYEEDRKKWWFGCSHNQ